MTILQWGAFGAAITALGCIGALTLWPYLNMLAEFFIDLGLEPLPAIGVTALLVWLVTISPLPFIWRRA